MCRFLLLQSCYVLRLNQICVRGRVEHDEVVGLKLVSVEWQTATGPHNVRLDDGSCHIAPDNGPVPRSADEHCQTDGQTG